MGQAPPPAMSAYLPQQGFYSPPPHPLQPQPAYISHIPPQHPPLQHNPGFPPTAVAAYPGSTTVPNAPAMLVPDPPQAPPALTPANTQCSMVKPLPTTPVYITGSSPSVAPHTSPHHPIQPMPPQPQVLPPDMRPVMRSKSPMQGHHFAPEAIRAGSGEVSSADSQPISSLSTLPRGSVKELTSSLMWTSSDPKAKEQSNEQLWQKPSVSCVVDAGRKAGDVRDTAGGSLALAPTPLPGTHTKAAHTRQ